MKQFIFDKTNYFIDKTILFVDNWIRKVVN